MSNYAWYLAGPMTNIPQFNVPFFDRVAAELRAAGWEIVNPAEKDSPEMRRRALASPNGNLATLEHETSESWGSVLSRDVKLVADEIKGIILLPNWFKSRGARLEAYVGLLTDKPFRLWMGHSSDPGSLDPDVVRQILRENMP